MARTVAFLRGINLGSRRRVAMAELRDLLAGHGYDDVQTLLQSGNVVLTASTSGARLERELERLLAFVEGLREREDAGERYTAEQADTLGSQAQRQAEAVAGQVTQAAQRLGIELQEA
jgi:hypothetical protein